MERESGQFSASKRNKGLTTFEKLSNQTALAASEHFIQSIPKYPGKYKGKGIVICAGGVRLFTSAWVCINMLRKLDCQLPIQLWYLGEREMDGQMKALVKPLGVQCVDALEMSKKVPSRILNGWELKAYALLHNPFEEVLLLDADNVPVVNPEFLFETRQYKETGAIFWPDLGRLQRERMIWKLCGVAYRDEPEFESGQILVNKEKCWKPLKLAMWYNEHSDFYFQHIHGDKETFHLAFRKLGKDYAMPPHRVILNSGVMYQHCFDGKVIFQHRNGPKWSYHNDNPKLPGFRFEDECFEFVRQLKEKWDGAIGIDFSGKSEKLKSVIQRLTSQIYEYRRVGYGQRPISFLNNGKIGVGQAGCEQLWDAHEDGENVWLEISSEQAKTCRLKLDGDGIWRGQWLVHEKMKVELFPAHESGDAIKNFNSRQGVEAAGKSQSCFYYDTMNGQRIIVGRMLGSYWLAAKEDDKGMSEHIMRDGFWESWITLWMVRNVKPGTVCIDAGANYGYFTFLLARLGCKVVAVEANPEIIPFLEKSVELNNCEKQVKVIHAAASAKRGKVKLNLKESTLNSTVIDIPTQQSYEVKAIALDSLREKAGFVKMDIEGAEESAWQGMKKLKGNCVTLMEFVPDHYKERGRLFFDAMNETHHISYVDFSGNEQPLSSHDFFLRDTEPFRMLVLRVREK
ncbi:MAG TPA: FkbM family methyltransferase [Chitinophagales bacterium]|nr:FkbM family methyltransferase [Chitinophagales bacterium]